MRPCSVFVRADCTVASAALKMLDEHVRELPVVDADCNLVGVVRVEDLFSITEPTIESAVRPARLVLPKDVSSLEAVRMMHKTGSQYAVVVEGTRLVGSIRWEDVLEKFSDY